MTEQDGNLILSILREIRAEIQEVRAEAAARDEKTQAQIGILAQGQNGMRVDMKRMTDHMHEIVIATDHHSSRLDRIEQHLGLDSAKH